MQIEGAVVREQGVVFAVVVVKSYVLTDRQAAAHAVATFSPVFGGVPVVLMAQDPRGRATYLGRPDLVRFLQGVPLSAVPWRRYTVR